jgi:hypothetical protein
LSLGCATPPPVTLNSLDTAALRVIKQEALDSARREVVYVRDSLKSSNADSVLQSTVTYSLVWFLDPNQQKMNSVLVHTITGRSYIEVQRLVRPEMIINIMSAFEKSRPGSIITAEDVLSKDYNDDQIWLYGIRINHRPKTLADSAPKQIEAIIK